MGIETRNGASVVSPATGPEDSADVALREAAHHLIEREFPEGKARVEYALSQHPGDPRGTFLLACIALEEKAWPEFDAAVAELNARLPDAPEVAMLAALAKARRGTQVPPTNAWTEFADTWIALGRPDWSQTAVLSKIDPFTEWGVTTREDHESNDARKRDDRARWFELIGSLSNREEDRAWLIARVSTVDEPADLRAAGFALLGSEKARALANDVFRHRVETMSGPDPLESSIELIPLVTVGLDVPLTNAEISHLEAVVDRPFASKGWGDAYQRAYSALSQHHIPSARALAFTYAVDSLNGPVPFDLQQRVKATEPGLTAENRVRLGKALWTLGERMARGKTLVELLVGLSFQRQGARLAANPEQLVAVDKAFEAARRTLRVSGGMTIEHWPLPSVADAALEDQLKDEVAHYARLDPEYGRGSKQTPP